MWQNCQLVSSLVPAHPHTHEPTVARAGGGRAVLAATVHRGSPQAQHPDAACITLIAVISSVSILNVAQRQLAIDFGVSETRCCGSSTPTRWCSLRC